MKRDGRTKAIEYYERKIREHYTALETIKQIPLDKMLHISYPVYTYDKVLGPRRSGACWKESGMILIPRKWNGDSLRCEILAVELTSFAADHVVRKEEHEKALMSPIRFLDIKSWKEFDRADAGLYVNWAALTREFKRIVYDQ